MLWGSLMKIDDKITDNEEKKPTYKEKRRNSAKEKRRKDQLSVTIFGIIVYSVVLIGVVVLAYVGFKTFINKSKERQAIIAEENEKALNEAKEAENKAAEEQKTSEEEKNSGEEDEESGEYKDKVFSVIENVGDPGNAPVNTFDFARKTLMPDDDGITDYKLLDYEVYTNPDNGAISKVTTRENCGDLYEITDYYYDDGKVNYIAQYREDTDVPIDLAGDKVESRFYFNDDKMVKYIYTENSKATEYSVKDFKLYSDGTIDQYKYMEDMMLETSKSAYKHAKELDEKVVISGYVLDETNCVPGEPATVQLLNTNGRVVEETKTNGDGYYEFEVEPDDRLEYHISVSGRDDMISTTVYGISACKGTKNVDVDTVYLAYTVYETIYPVQIFVKDADDANKALNGASVKFRGGLNNRNGEVFLSGVLGNAGEIMPALRSGNYTAEITKDGYETCYVPFTIKSDHTALVAYAVKDVPEGSVKTVLSYEMTPLDLDLRVFDTYGRNISKSRNDSVGITTPEAITLDNIDSGTYTFYVSNYTDIVACDMMSYRLSQSGAKLYVYDSDGLKTVLSVPAAHSGIVWRAFEIRNHKIITINDYYSYIVDDSIFRNK